MVIFRCGESEIILPQISLATYILLKKVGLADSLGRPNFRHF